MFLKTGLNPPEAHLRAPAPGTMVGSGTGGSLG